VAKLSLKIDVIGQIGALDFAIIHIIGFLDQTHKLLTRCHGDGEWLDFRLGMNCGVK